MSRCLKNNACGNENNTVAMNGSSSALATSKTSLGKSNNYESDENDRQRKRRDNISDDLDSTRDNEVFIMSMNQQLQNREQENMQCLDECNNSSKEHYLSHQPPSLKRPGSDDDSEKYDTKTGGKHKIAGHKALCGKHDTQFDEGAGGSCLHQQWKNRDGNSNNFDTNSTETLHEILQTEALQHSSYARHLRRHQQRHRDRIEQGREEAQRVKSPDPSNLPGIERPVQLTGLRSQPIISEYLSEINRLLQSLRENCNSDKEKNISNQHINLSQSPFNEETRYQTKRKIQTLCRKSHAAILLSQQMKEEDQFKRKMKGLQRRLKVKRRRIAKLLGLELFFYDDDDDDDDGEGMEMENNNVGNAVGDCDNDVPHGDNSVQECEMSGVINVAVDDVGLADKESMVKVAVAESKTAALLVDNLSTAPTNGLNLEVKESDESRERQHDHVSNKTTKGHEDFISTSTSNNNLKSKHNSGETNVANNAVTPTIAPRNPWEDAILLLRRNATKLEQSTVELNLWRESMDNNYSCNDANHYRGNNYCSGRSDGFDGDDDYDEDAEEDVVIIGTTAEQRINEKDSGLTQHSDMSTSHAVANTISSRNNKKNGCFVLASRILQKSHEDDEVGEELIEIYERSDGFKMSNWP